MLLLRKRLCINCSSLACTSLGNIPCLKFGRNNLNSYNSKTHVTDNSNKFWIPLRIRITWVQKYLLFVFFIIIIIIIIITTYFSTSFLFMTKFFQSKGISMEKLTWRPEKNLCDWSHLWILHLMPICNKF